jgi:hypothetical protein
MNPPKLQKPIFYMVLFFALTILSCKKNNGTAQLVTADATIINGGPAAADGCGWLIKIDATDSIYNAPNLTAKYQVDRLKVNITYHKLSTRFYCGDVVPALDPGMTEIQLTTIKIR